MYQQKLTHLNAFELTEHLDVLCKREEQIADWHMPSDSAVSQYLTIVRATILEDL